MAKKVFVAMVAGLITGENDPLKRAEKIQTQVVSGIKGQLALKAGERLDLLDRVERARERVGSALGNDGKDVTDRSATIQGYLNAKLELKKSEEALENHDLIVQWLEEGLETAEA